MRLHELAAAEMSLAFRSRQLSPVEVTRAVLDRIAACEPKLNAMFLVQAERALRQARASEARWAQGHELSPLDGVPITIKDNIATLGDPMPFGTAALDGLPPSQADSPPAARVKEAGCVVLGKTTMPDFGMLVSGVSTKHGVTRNPWSLAHNSGGSSSGAGAAIAAGYGPLALGTDIAGSVRLPAAYCGITALKPSLGRVPIHPPYTGRVTGPMTRNVTDAAMLMDILCCPDVRDFTSLPPIDGDFTSGIEGLHPRGLRLGLLLDMGIGTAPTTEVRDAVEAAARSLQAAGAIVEPVAGFVDGDMRDGADRFFRTRLLVETSKLPPERQARVHPFLRAWAGAATGWSADNLMRALGEIWRLREAAVVATVPFDFVLMPTSPIPAYAAEEPCPGSDPEHAFDHVAFTLPFNLSEQPAASIPCGWTSGGLPIGLQIVGRRFDDRGVLRLAQRLEEMLDAKRPLAEP